MEQGQLIPLSFDQLPGWQQDDHAAAFRAFYQSALKCASTKPPKTRALGICGLKLFSIMKQALNAPQPGMDAADARRFFETHFMPCMFHNENISEPDWPGLLTGYYEPEIYGALSKSGRFSVPLLKRPHDLVGLKPEQKPADWPQDLRFARKTRYGMQPYFDRAAIEGSCFADGVLAKRKLELVWLADHVEAFFIHIQGSASIQLKEGGTMRVSYDGKSGHAYTPIGRVLKAEAALPPDNITMQSIKAWLHAHPDEQRRILHQNRSYIFFKADLDLNPELGPRAAADVQLTPGRSLAVDRLLHTFHTPIYLYTKPTDQPSIHRLMIAQDTGSAIVGTHRGDFFVGSGARAGELAGRLATPAKFTLLAPAISC